MVVSTKMQLDVDVSPPAFSLIACTNTDLRLHIYGQWSMLYLENLEIAITIGDNTAYWMNKDFYI